MRKIYLIIILLTFISCSSQNKKSLSEHSCECINKISTELSGQKLTAEIQKCAVDGYEKYSNEVQKIMIDYMNDNSNSDLTSAQNYVGKVLTMKLIKECPRYAKITSDIVSKKRPVSSNIVQTVADEICDEINKLKQTKLSDKIVDPIFMKVTMKYDNQIRSEYNLSDREQMKKYAYDLSFKLMAVCKKYKIFGIQKLK
tara:strand:- start:1249 stop:1845 length:597 start_codon:yes stop_codon:yes gene_type:complete